ncbi:Uncharacterized protein APZ42_011290 [Daphnia magna]|uniref:Uncharacterized protein n=1 Tax=Daphnia magna TaxID=35525 RepID=A0A162SJT7_9CRUS|nr:Uncharacterized protein APZ42_011290 [Daphnia magna]
MKETERKGEDDSNRQLLRHRLSLETTFHNTWAHPDATSFCCLCPDSLYLISVFCFLFFSPCPGSLLNLSITDLCCMMQTFADVSNDEKRSVFSRYI